MSPTWRFANIRLNALNMLGDIINELDNDYREIDGKIYCIEDGPEKDKLKRQLEAISKVRGRFKYKRFKLKDHIRKKNEYNATKSYTEGLEK